MFMELPRTKSGLSIVQEAVNRAIADGFEPFDPNDPHQGPTAAEVAERRLGFAPGLISKGIEKGTLHQDRSLFCAEDRHRDLFQALREAGVEIASDERARRHVRSLMDERRKFKKLIDEIDRQNVTMEEVRTKLYRLPLERPDIPNWVVAPRLAEGSPGVPMTIWSDWHYGEVVETKAMSGKNAYNLAIADARIEQLVDRIIDIAIRHQASPRYPGIVVCLGGDLFSGDGLHEETTDTNEKKTIGLFMRLQGRLIWAIEQMADHFGAVFVPCDFGNHGRNTLKPRYKLRAETNYEYLLYNQLEAYFRNNPKYADKVTFRISEGAGVHFTVGSEGKGGAKGHRYYLIHGDQMGVKGGDGIIGSLGPIMRGRIKVGSSESSIDQPFETLILAHWHQDLYLNGIIVNGALKGWCEYARLALRAPYAPPSQTLWFNHPAFGPVRYHKIILDHKKLTQPRPEKEPPLFPNAARPQIVRSDKTSGTDEPGVGKAA